MPNNEFTFAPSANGSFLAAADALSVGVLVPVTGATVQLMGRRETFINTAALAALTLRFPAQPVQGDREEIGFAAAITALTLLDASGVAIPAAPTSAAAGVSIEFRYLGGAWRRWR